MEGTNVTANCLHPGVIATKLLDDYMGGSHDAGFGSGESFGDSPEQGAAVVLHVASSPEIDGITGKYFHDNAVRETAPVTYDEEHARQLWDASAKLTGLTSWPAPRFR